MLKLFWEFFRISLCVIGGGYAIIAVADPLFAKKGWIEEGELLDHLPVFQMVPGLIATHTAVYVGRKVAGWRGALVSVLAVALPAVAIFTLVAVGYANLPLENRWVTAAFAGLRSSLTGIIAATIVRNWMKTMKSAFAYCLAAAVLGAIVALGVAVPGALLGAMAAGIAATCLVPSAGEGKRFNASFLPLLLFAKYGLLGFGGGFVLVPMYLEDFVGAAAPYLQISEDEFSNVMALSQMTPGPVGVNCATFFGYRLAGVAGAILASVALLLPGSLIVYGALASLDRFRDNRLVQGIMKGIRPASIALMLIALAAFARTSCASAPSVGLTLASGVLAYLKKANVVLLILLSAIAGLILC